MLKDNQLSTILLLVFLGFLIYHLTKPKTIGECFAEEGSKSESELRVTNLNPNINQEVLNQVLVEAELPKVEVPAPVINVKALTRFPLKLCVKPGLPILTLIPV